MRCKDGKPYSPRSLISIRASIQRYLTSPTVNRHVNIMKDADFARANGILKHMVGLWLKEGNVSSQFPAIEPDDLRKMSEYFTRDSPEKLQFEVWYSLVYHFGLRGREIISSVALSDVNISFDSDSRSFVSVK